MSPRRKLLLALGGAGMLGGCGFRPVYGPDGERNIPAGAVSADLATVRVGPINDRSGQLFRRNLQRRLEGSRPGTPSRYVLNPTLAYEVEVEGLRGDGLATRVRYIATILWNLTTDAVPPTIVASDRIRIIDAFNLPDLQFFSSEVARDAMERRIIDEASDRLILAVATVLRRQRSAAG